MVAHISFLLLTLLLRSHVFAQSLAAPQSNTWNSTFALTAEQTSQANLSAELVEAINVAVRFERTNWAGGSAASDPFYIPPANSSKLPCGSLLSVEPHTNTSLYTLPPNTAMSRIVFQSETANGTAVPASAYVLWPWMPRQDPKTGKLAVVGWAHGTSGCFGECAPSHIRNLWYQYSTPYILALQGYVVVAPDYAGLGVSRWPNGTRIKHTYIAGAAHANDLFFAVEAAQLAFPELSSRFVLMGHSQGGLATWAAAERQARRPVSGYLGAISGSPTTDIESQIRLVPQLALVTSSYAAAGLDAILPYFRSSDWLTEAGVRRLSLFQELEGCNNAATQLLPDPSLVRPDFMNSTSFQAFKSLASAGGQPVAGPLLVLQGSMDSLVPAELVTKAVGDTCSQQPDSQLEYAFLNGTDHVPTLYAAQRIWLDWIADRFSDTPQSPGCSRRNFSSFWPQDVYQANGNYYLEYATQGYQVA